MDKKDEAAARTQKHSAEIKSQTPPISTPLYDGSMPGQSTCLHSLMMPVGFYILAAQGILPSCVEMLEDMQCYAMHKVKTMQIICKLHGVCALQAPY
jgi:hypothetical protein